MNPNAQGPESVSEAECVIPKSSFTRVASLWSLRGTELVDVVSQLRQGGMSAGWIPLGAGRRREQAKFFFPWVGGYWTGDVADIEGMPAVQAFEWHEPRIERDRSGAAASTARKTKKVTTARDIVPRLELGGFRADLYLAELYVFDTGIVALVTEWRLRGVRAGEGEQWRKPTLGDLARFNYELRAPLTIPQQKALQVARRTGSTAHGRMLAVELIGEGRTVREVHGGLFRFLLPSAVDVRHVKSEDERSHRLQTFALLPGGTDLDSLGQALFELRRVVKETYLAPPGQTSLGESNEVLRTYSNIVIGVAVEGLCMLVADRKPQIFRQLKDHFRTSYFSHWLMALHQRTGLKALGSRAAAIPLPRRGKHPERRTIEAAKNVRMEVIRFNLRHRFTRASIHSTYDRLYEALRAQLGLAELEAEIESDVRELDDMLMRHSQEEAAAQDRLLNRLVSVLGVAAILTSVYGMSLWPFGSVGSDAGVYWTAMVLVPLALAVLLGGAILAAVERSALPRGRWGEIHDRSSRQRGRESGDR